MRSLIDGKRSIYLNDILYAFVKEVYQHPNANFCGIFLNDNLAAYRTNIIGRAAGTDRGHADKDVPIVTATVRCPSVHVRVNVHVNGF